MHYLTDHAAADPMMHIEVMPSVIETVYNWVLDFPDSYKPGFGFYT